MEELLQHFQNIQSIIQRNKAGALFAANSYMLSTYWEVGAYLSYRLTERIYGTKVVAKLAEWLQNQEPGIKGFDRRSLYRMRDFFETWFTVDWAGLNLPKYLITNPFLDLSEKILPYEMEIVGSVIPQSPPLPLIISRITIRNST
ncbi:MAG: hypothetical protein HUU01_20520 [Saprospiraceae bacterium]|nr:hypothetical protein [Saprospiraceae bacterium]